MLSRQHLFLLASLTLLCVAETLAAAGQNLAVLVAGSNGWDNYRNQADVCHAYQILHKNGIPDSNIVVMMYDDIANNPQNPSHGIIINHLQGNDVYKSVPHDYVGDNVTSKNFLNVLLGNKTAMASVGSGKVIESGPDDNIFLYYVGYGAVGLLPFPTGGSLYTKDFITAIVQMHIKKKYKNMVIYTDAGESGSILENLPPNINVYATACNYMESSQPCYYVRKLQTFVGDLYSVRWMEDSDVEDISTESLFKQFQVTQMRVSKNDVREYGDLVLGKAHNVSEFQGANKNKKYEPVDPLVQHMNALLKRDAVPTVEVRQSILSHRLAALSADSTERADLERKLAQVTEQRNTISSTIESIARRSFQINGDLNKVLTQHMGLTQHDCYISTTQHLHKKCFDIQNEYVLNKLYIVANLCEIGLKDFTINNAIDDVCNVLGRQSFQN